VLPTFPYWPLSKGPIEYDRQPQMCQKKQIILFPMKAQNIYPTESWKPAQVRTLIPSSSLPRTMHQAYWNERHRESRNRNIHSITHILRVRYLYCTKITEVALAFLFGLSCLASGRNALGYYIPSSNSSKINTLKPPERLCLMRSLSTREPGLRRY
jgi:hypothetical protein